MEDHTGRRGRLEKRLKDIGFKNQTPDAVVLQDLCRALELPIAKSDGGGLKRPELVEQIVSTLMAEGSVPGSRVDQSCFGLAMQLCWLVDGSQWDVDTAARQVCDTVERCVCAVAVLTGTEEEDLLGRHQGFGYWVERLVRLSPGFLRYTRMLRDSLPSHVPYNFRFSQQISWEIDPKMTACVVVQNVWLFVLAMEYCEEQGREKWRKLFGTADAFLFDFGISSCGRSLSSGR